jgi:hypothetical protein
MDIPHLLRVRFSSFSTCRTCLFDMELQGRYITLSMIEIIKAERIDKGRTILDKLSPY